MKKISIKYEDDSKSIDLSVKDVFNERSLVDIIECFLDACGYSCSIKIKPHDTCNK